MHTALWVLATTSVVGAGVSLLRPRHEIGVEGPTVRPAQAFEEAVAEEIEAVP